MLRPSPAGSYPAITRAVVVAISIKLTFDFTPRWWLGERECAGTASLYRGPLLLACDQRYNRLELDKLPHLSLSQLTYEPAAYRGAAPAPDLIVQVRSITGHDLILCDFASAGSCGTPYRTWLPITD